MMHEVLLENQALVLNSQRKLAVPSHVIHPLSAFLCQLGKSRNYTVFSSVWYYGKHFEHASMLSIIK